MKLDTDEKLILQRAILKSTTVYVDCNCRITEELDDCTVMAIDTKDFKSLSSLCGYIVEKCVLIEEESAAAAERNCY